MRNGDYACAIFWRDGRLLLGKRGPHRRAYPNCWDVLGGKVEAGETLERALVREMREEIGLSPRSIVKLVEISDTDARYHIHLVRKWDGGEPVMRGHEHTELCWFSIAEACAQPHLALTSYRDLFRQLGDLVKRQDNPEP